VLRALEPVMPKGLRKRAIDKCVEFVHRTGSTASTDSRDLSAMENSLKMYAVLGYPPDHPDRAIARASVDKRSSSRMTKPIANLRLPVWTPRWSRTRCSKPARERDRGGQPRSRLAQAAEVLDVKGDWIERVRSASGRWAFQYNNPHLSDLDYTRWS